MKKLVITTALLASGIAQAGPFGLDMGTPLTVLRKQLPLKPEGRVYAYWSPTVPKPHESFDTFMFLVTPGQGLCLIRAAGKDVRTSVYGTELKTQFETVSSALKSRYGKPSSDFNFLKAGSIWNEPRDWMTALHNKERTLAQFWTGEGLPDDLAAVSLEAVADDTRTGWVVLEYQFKNAIECIEERGAKKNSSL